MDFLEALKNVTGRKDLPDRSEVGGMVWGVKRQLSMNHELLPIVAYLDQFQFALGNERFYELLVHCMPGGRYFAKGIKKDELQGDGLSDEIRRKACRYYGVRPSELPVLLEVVGADAINDTFGVQKSERPKKKRKAKRKKTAKKRR